MLCLREEGREGAGDGSLFPFTLDDTRLFLSGLHAAREAGEDYFLSIILMSHNYP